MSKTKIVPTNWSVAQIWNEAVWEEERPLISRDYIYGSEIGTPYIDRFYKMKAVPYTNPPNDRSKRKFIAGNVWEYVVKQILVATGVFKHEEMKIDATPYPGLLSVHGRADFVCGGYIDGEQALVNVSFLTLPDFLHKIADRIIGKLAGATIQKKILELKAVSTFAMDMVERRRCAIPNHSLQAYHYQKNTKIPAEIIYVGKDDCRLQQFALDKKECEKLYRQDIEEMTFYYRKNKIPPPAPLAKFETTTGQFSKNLAVEYSPYLTMIYGFKNQDEYREATKFTMRWNRALARFALVANGSSTPTGKPITITPKNLEVKKEIIAAKFNFEECLKSKIAAGIAEEEIE